MTMHYHGTPITPREKLFTMKGRHFCVSFSEPRDINVCLQIGQSVMIDNGAFSVWKRGATVDWFKYYAFVEKYLTPPHWAIIPEVIEETIE